MSYYSELSEQMQKAMAAMPEGGLSRVWSKHKKKATDPIGIVHDLIRIQYTVKNLLRVHGIPPETIVEVGTLAQGMSGSAGYTDADVPNLIRDYTRSPDKYFKHPMISIDKSIYEFSEMEEIMDTYCGVGLHEASHVKHTRNHYIRQKAGGLKGERLLYEGLLEDERIEELVRKESPGFAPYLVKVKQNLFEKAEFGRGRKHWGDLPDLDKLSLIAFGVLRCPNLLNNTHKEFQLIDGTKPFEDICGMLPHIPKDEEEVELFGGRLIDYIEEKRKLYGEEIENQDKSGEQKKQWQPGSQSNQDSKQSGGGSGSDSNTVSDDGSSADGKSSDSGDESKGNSTGSSKQGKELSEQEKKKRLDKQKQADAEDKKLEDKIKDVEKAAREFASTDPKQFDKIENITDAEKERYKKKRLDKTDKALKKLQKQLDKLTQNRAKRFNSQEIEKMVRRMETCEKPLDAKETQAMASMMDEKLELDSWDSGLPFNAYGQTSGRILVYQPRVTVEGEQRYKLIHEQIKADVQKMKNVFNLRLGVQTVTSKEQIEGRLDRTRLGRAMSTNRIFKQSHKQTTQGIAICLLLDESGSMGTADLWQIQEPWPTKAVSALKVGTLFAEAIKGNKGIELEVYSHTSQYGYGSGEDVVIKHLYGNKTDKKLSRLAEYIRGSGNYDYLAIDNVAQRFIRDTENDNRLLIVISDGQPCSFTGNGVAETKVVVDRWRNKGLGIMGVAIENYKCESIYGEKHTVKFLNMTTLVKDMRNVVLHAVKQASQKKVKV